MQHDGRLASLLLFGLLACLCLGVRTGMAVSPASTWTTGLTGPSRFTAGDQRMLVFAAGMEAGADRTITSAAYGGQPLTLVATSGAGDAWHSRTYIFVLNETGLQAATNDTFSVSWSGGLSEVRYSARIYANVNQEHPVSGFSVNGTAYSTPNPMTTSALSAVSGDYLVAAAHCGNSNSYSWNNGFIEGTDQAASSSTHSAADRAVTADGSVTPSATSAYPNRQTIAAAVLAGEPPELQTFYVRPDGNDSNSGSGPAPSQAWATLTAAVQKTELGPNCVIHVMPGTYNGSLYPNSDGAANLPIRFIADTRGAVFGNTGDVVVNASGAAALTLRYENYYEFEGFTFVGGPYFVVEIDDSVGVVLDRCEITGGTQDGVELQDTAAAQLINCVIHANGGYGVHVNNSNVDLDIYHCTIASNGYDGVKQQSGDVVARNNIFYGNGDDGYDHDSGARTCEYNLSYGNVDDSWSGFTADGTNLTADPLFIDAATGDYRLQAASPALNVGTNISDIEEDFQGYPRKIGAAPEIGAFEYPLAGWWKLNDGSGTTAADSAGSNDGEVYGNLDWRAHCGGDTDALAFDGTIDYVEIPEPANDDLDVAEQFTLMAWIKVDGNQDVPMRIASKKPSWNATAGFQLVYHPSANQLTLNLKDQQMLIAENVDLNMGWQHVAATLAPSPSSSRFEAALYVNGAKLTSDATAYSALGVESSDGLFDAVESDDTAWRIGRPAGAGSAYYQGEIRDVRLYGAALSDAEIAAVTGLVLHWKLDETSGNSAADASGGGYIGLLSGSENWTTGGKRDGAFEFTGSQKFENAFVADAINGLDAITVSLWVKSDLTDQDRGIFFGTTPDGADDNLGMRYDKDGAFGGEDQVIKLALRTTSGSTALESSAMRQTTQWQHLALVWSAGSAPQFYIDGVLDAPSASASVLTGTISGVDKFMLGQGTKSQYWDGKIDDVRIYGRALCSDEIAGIASGGGGPLRIMTWVEVK